MNQSFYSMRFFISEYMPVRLFNLHQGLVSSIPCLIIYNKHNMGFRAETTYTFKRVQNKILSWTNWNYDCHLRIAACTQISKLL